MSEYYSKHRNDPKQVATLIVFAEGVTPERVQAWVDKLKAQGFAESAQTQTFVPAIDHPTLYFP